MKNKVIVMLFLLPFQVVFGQQKQIDSLKEIINYQKRDIIELHALEKLIAIYSQQNQWPARNVYIQQRLLLARELNYSPRKDTSEVVWLINLASMYAFSNPDSSIMRLKEALDLARQLNYVKGEEVALFILGENLRVRGEFPEALGHLFNALLISRDIEDKEMEKNCLAFIGIAYVELGEYRQGLNYLYQAKEMDDKLPLQRNNGVIGFQLSYIGQAYEKLNMPDSALFFQQQALLFQQKGLALKEDEELSPLKSWILTRFGIIQVRLGNYSKALSYYREAIQIKDLLNLGIAQYLIADLFYTLHQPDSSLHYASLAFINSQRSFQKTYVLDASILLVKLYKAKNNIDSAFHYQQISLALKDSLFGPEKFRKLQLLTISEQQRQQEIITRQAEIQLDKERFENKVKMFTMLATIGVFLLIAIILYRNIRQKQKAAILLQQQKVKIENTLLELKSTQQQLIQSEKMASLGELTAGIAHEIQNPLNFVNNFSEVNRELVDEMEEALRKDDKEEAITIALDIKGNLEKINHHGKRADAIVKGMLQHSRITTGQKEPTDINALADEYLRLSYHGLRAKDKLFNATLQTGFDESIGKINIVPQDIGRVLLNLYNNAFYSVTEKKKALPLKGGNYEPTVSVSTKAVKLPPAGGGRGLEIRVKDNGIGIPQKVLDKIFQPFFTTKPTGQGTGLGLSLSYDITKAHGGELKVETKEGDGAEFIIRLPLKETI